MNLITLLVFSVFQFTKPIDFDSIPNYPKGDFRSPLDIPILLSGNFGEPRKAHFHTGLDIRTQEREGLNVYAVGDGYVSRIGVAAGGYGNALYITHPNGYTSVYAHLQKFSERIEARLRQVQYAKQRFAVDITFMPNELPVSQGEVVARSGNTGGSGGPHLHFEIRDSLERPINPMHFGFVPNDHIAPIIGAVKFYALDQQRFSTDGFRLPVTWQGTTYVLKNDIVKLNCKHIGIAINTYDKMDNAIHTYGVYTMKLRDNGKLLYHYQLDRISFDDKRQIICQVDYPIFLKEGSRSFHKCFQEYGNTLPAYPTNVQRGVIALDDSQPHYIEIEVTDFAGNKSLFNTIVQYDPGATAFKPKPRILYNHLLDCKRDNAFSSPQFSYQLPARSLRDSVFVNYTTKKNEQGLTVHQFGDVTEHLLDYFQLKIAADEIPAALRAKVVVTWRDEKGKFVSKAGKMEGATISTKTRELGSYSLAIDTTPPTLTPLNIAAGKNMRSAKKILLRTGDNLSGVADYNAYIDERWELMEYDAKYGLLRILPRSDMADGLHHLRVVVTDERGNSNELATTFMW